MIPKNNITECCGLVSIMAYIYGGEVYATDIEIILKLLIVFNQSNETLIYQRIGLLTETLFRETK